MSIIERQHRPAFVVLFVAFVLFGTSVTVIGAALPRVLADFAWDYLAAGLVIAAGSLGYFLSAYVAGRLVDRIGFRAAMAAGAGPGCPRPPGLRGDAFGDPQRVPLFPDRGGAGLHRGGRELVHREDGAGALRPTHEPHARCLLHRRRRRPAWPRAPSSPGPSPGSHLPGHRGALPGAAGGLLPDSRPGAGRVARQLPAHHRAELHGEPAFWLGFLVLMLYVGVEMGLSNWMGEFFVAGPWVPPRLPEPLRSPSSGEGCWPAASVCLCWFAGSRQERVLHALGVILAAATFLLAMVGFTGGVPVAFAGQRTGRVRLLLHLPRGHQPGGGGLSGCPGGGHGVRLGGRGPRGLPLPAGHGLRGAGPGASARAMWPSFPWPSPSLAAGILLSSAAHRRARGCCPGPGS